LQSLIQTHKPAYYSDLILQGHQNEQQHCFMAALHTAKLSIGCSAAAGSKFGGVQAMFLILQLPRPKTAKRKGGRRGFVPSIPFCNVIYLTAPRP
jgi:hypothetical protein